MQFRTTFLSLFILLDGAQIVYGDPGIKRLQVFQDTVGI